MDRSIELNDELVRIIEETAETAEYLWQRGWAERNGGNISVNVTHLLPKNLPTFHKYPLRSDIRVDRTLAGHAFLITGSGMKMRDVARYPEATLCILHLADDLSGYHYLWGAGSKGFRPSSELPSHLAIHRFLVNRSPKKRVILHCHPDELIALTHVAELQDETVLNQLLWSMLPETVIFVPRGVGLVSYSLTGSQSLAESTRAVLADHDVALWEKHGVLAVGKTVPEAFDTIDVLNKAARIFFTCKNAGFSPEGLTREQISELQARFRGPNLRS